jgi:hypothetical protein
MDRGRLRQTARLMKEAGFDGVERFRAWIPGGQLFLSHQSGNDTRHPGEQGEGFQKCLNQDPTQVGPDFVVGVRLMGMAHDSGTTSEDPPNRQDRGRMRLSYVHRRPGVGSPQVAVFERTEPCFLRLK